LFFVTSWQDQHESNKLTFDGIVDRKGRPKNEYFKLQHFLGESGTVSNNKTVSILKPAMPVFENDVLHYYSMLYKDGEGWIDGQNTENYFFEWSLVKQDEHGNHLAIRDIHNGPVLRLKIPKNHEYFKLLLTVTDGNSIATTITKLNTPLVDD